MFKHLSAIKDRSCFADRPATFSPKHCCIKIIVIIIVTKKLKDQVIWEEIHQVVAFDF